jgi:hypothetical protein
MGNTKTFIQDKNDWINFCKENNVKSFDEYNELCTVPVGTAGYCGYCGYCDSWVLWVLQVGTAEHIEC